MASLDDLLAASVWARELEPPTLRRVRCELAERLVPAGSYVCRKGEPVEHWIGVIQGLVKISSVSPEGRAVTFTGITEGGWFGEGSVLRCEPWRYDAVALRDSRVALMPRATFFRLLDGSIAFNRFLLNQLNERLALFIAIIESDRLLEPDAHVARCLAGLFNPLLYPGIGERLQISQEEIGYLTGLSRQRVNQALQALEKAGLLEAQYGAVIVRDLDGLRAYRP
jgi:CRP/FNR family transcriptional regulator, cyclic AMP receptor protein